MRTDRHTRRGSGITAVRFTVTIPQKEFNRLSYLSECTDMNKCLILKALLYHMLIQTSEENLEDLVNEYQEYRMER